ncbi:MAG TPA: cyclopropane-fatty-acyl-phospholipid synthase family protein [Steroidobacteraceae bacterium]
MNGVSLASTMPSARGANWLERALRRRVLELLRGMRDCDLLISEGAARTELSARKEGSATPLSALVQIHDPAFYRFAALQGSVGAAEAFMEGLWDCDDLVALVRILVRNRDRLDAMERGPARIGGVLLRAWAALRPNTSAGSRRNIAAHYDLGNELFKLFLDDNLMYSSALFASEHDSLEAASTRKLERICEKLELSPETRVIEIGTGWGGFALHAATHHGCHVTTTTISREQYELACSRVVAAGLQDRVDVLLTDYRQLRGRYDRLVSIEMIEAIGHRQLGAYFHQVGELLHDDGMALVQAITIEDYRYAQALRSVDFIQRHIFPGSFLPSISAMLSALARVSDLKLFNLEDIGPSYALTLRAWRQRFIRQREKARALGYPERFLRMWEFYLAYCEGAFIERSIGDVQMLLVKPRARRQQYVPGLLGIGADFPGCGLIKDTAQPSAET